ncbi:amino acid ABC transporter ATP-binding protein [Rhodoplanes roseus]|uniref:Ectoine/hydroxyectoine ABC transporter ATP-binding protein EhuA n=1 Tax=Rhodoplanes roseus TaxID=29409 RepID=A0A327KSZ5_9BRAD|nr:amino acid ABC transporter ATP-binding protein [Rhodoplanes roseus]RAI41417.1 ectoine/hydroxyectoine ABC transporter ATP-binding protein EhuA [Rhodoplanes roseus]
MQTMVRLSGLCKSFGPHRVLRDITLDVAAGEVVCVIGPSGSGKSTMLRCINHLEKPDSGTITVDGELIGYEREGDNLRELSSKRIAAQRAKMGMVFQRFNLFPHLTVLQNIVEAPVAVRKMPKQVAEAEAMRLLKLVDLTEKASAYPSALSGGQMQRVAIARALAMQPRLVLFDEPTSALDPELVGEVLEVMRELATTGITMIVVTHEISFARDIGDKLVFMAEGQIVETGEPKAVIEDPKHARTREFLSRFR